MKNRKKKLTGAANFEDDDERWRETNEDEVTEREKGKI